MANKRRPSRHRAARERPGVYGRWRSLLCAQREVTRNEDGRARRDFAKSTAHLHPGQGRMITAPGDRFDKYRKPPPELALFDVRTVFDPEKTAMETLRSIVGEEERNSSVAWIAMPSPSGELVIDYVHGANTTLISGLLVPGGVGLTGKVFQRGSVEWVEHYAAATSITHEFDAVIDAEGVVRMLAAPLGLTSEVFGVLTIASRTEGTFGGVAADHILDIARQTSLALEIARESRDLSTAAAAVERRRVSGVLREEIGDLLLSLDARTDRLGQRLRSLGGVDEDYLALRRSLVQARQDLLERSVIADGSESPFGVRQSSAPPRLIPISPALTPRERQVLQHVATGKTNAEIAAELGLTASTVKTYWQTAMQKLGVRNRVEAVDTALRLGILDPPR